MNRSPLLAILFIASALTAGCSPVAKAPDTAAMIAAADALDKAFIEAMNAGDAEAMAACYWNSPEVVSFPPGTLEARGFEGILEDTRATFAAMPGMKVELTEVHQMPAGDMVIGWGLWRGTMPMPDGTEMEILGRYTDVKAERDGKWVYLLDHASAPFPPPPSEG
jgi:uncharacterized protein (TIGR02246 family)